MTENAYNKVSQIEFNQYLDSIRKQIQEVIPAWKLNTQVMDNQVLYHLCRQDFTAGKDAVWPVEIYTNIFAYEIRKLNEPNEYWLFNQAPIGDKK